MRNLVGWRFAIVAALGGFLFGFDTIVINGAEQDIQRLWGLSGTMHGLVVSSALWGTVVGALGGGLAFLAEWGIYNGISEKLLGSIAGNFITVVPFASLSLIVLVLYVGLGVVVGVFGGLNAIRNYLKV